MGPRFSLIRKTGEAWKRTHDPWFTRQVALPLNHRLLAKLLCISETYKDWIIHNSARFQTCIMIVAHSKKLAMLVLVTIVHILRFSKIAVQFETCKLCTDCTIHNSVHFF